MKHMTILTALLALSLLLSACAATEPEDIALGEPEAQMIMANAGEEAQAVRTTSEPYTANSKVADVMNDPAFGDYGRLLLPVNSGYWSGDTLGALRLTWYSNIDPNKTVEIVNTLKVRAETGAKFAVCNAGGGFAYVGAMHDSFPHALELSKMGYNAFALIYRPGWTTAMEDLGRAISFIENNAESLGVDPDGYSLWGGSAGARMAATLGNADDLAYYTGRTDIPQAAAVVMQYTGHTETSHADAPTYACCGTSDGIANYRTMEKRLNTLTSSYGIPTEFHAYNGLSHGFGLGTGTVAEGWINDAVAFWEANQEEMVTIPQTGMTTAVPASYFDAAAQQGTVVRIEYESKDYAGSGAAITKPANVYLLYGYDEDDTDTRYNIFYFMHGWTGSADEFFTIGDGMIKKMLDHMIANGDIPPMIFVAATFDTENAAQSFGRSVSELRQFHQDFANDLMPAVEGRFHTYAQSASKEDLIASCDHRAFGGFSLGAVTTWMQFCYNYDYIRYFVPMSGACWYYGGYGDYHPVETCDFFERLIEENDLNERGYFIYACTGTRDAVLDQVEIQMREMLRRGDVFTPEHVVYYMKQGGVHDFNAVQEYVYNALPVFFGGAADQGGTI